MVATHILVFPESFLNAPYLMGGHRSVRAGQLGEDVGRGGEAGLRGKGSGRGGAAPGRLPPISSPAPAPALPRTCAGLPPSPGGSRRAALGDQRIRRSRARGRGRGISPHACLGLLPSPSPARLGPGGAPLGEFHCAGRAQASLGWGSYGKKGEDRRGQAGTRGAAAFLPRHQLPLPVRD